MQFHEKSGHIKKNNKITEIIAKIIECGNVFNSFIADMLIYILAH